MFDFLNIDEDLSFFIGLSVQMRTSFDQLNFVNEKLNNGSYETDYRLFFSYYYADGYNELIINLSFIYDNDASSKYNFFRYVNHYLKNIDKDEVFEGVMGEEQFTQVLKNLTEQKKKLNSYKTQIMKYRSKNVAHIDKNHFKELIPMDELKEVIAIFFELVHNIAYYKYKYFPMYTFSY